MRWLLSTPSVPVPAPDVVLLLGAAELEVDDDDVLEALGGPRLLEAREEGVEGDLRERGARLGVHLHGTRR